MGAADQQARVAKLMAAAKRWHQPLLAEAFAEWTAQAREQRALSGALQAAVAHWMHAALGSAFNTWRYQASRGVVAGLGASILSTAGAVEQERL